MVGDGACSHSISQRASKSHYWFKSYGNFSEWADFAYWWSFSGGGSAINGATPSSFSTSQEYECGFNVGEWSNLEKNKWNSKIHCLLTSSQESLHEHCFSGRRSKSPAIWISIRKEILKGGDAGAHVPANFLKSAQNFGF